MSSPQCNIASTAQELVDLHGEQARQRVVDSILKAIREHDILAAKRWEQIGHAVDQELAA